MGKEEVEMLLLFDHFSPLDRWKILIAWCKSHLSSDIGLELLSDLPDVSLYDSASKLIEPLLPAVDLFKMRTEDLALVVLYDMWLPEVVQNLLRFHTKATTPSGVNKWKPDQRSCITNQEVKNILAATKPYLSQRLRSSGARGSPSLLFHAKPAGFSHELFHEACDDKMNTLTVIQLRDGCIIGGFADHPWGSNGRLVSCENAFLFIMVPNGTVIILPCVGKNNAMFCHLEHGPSFGGGDLVVNKSEVSGLLRSYSLFSSFDEDETCAFVEYLCAGVEAFGEIEDCKVFQILA
ncbi:hypothetical protein BJ741DRAFT_216669 [Chytriomyces cf. hyalinus JEL632]|nr:hypothetical protein BJ741DRAFT_216669 [Chytriomyces cf. hyalinus JEL632]